jgi:hypothetical protein
VNGYVEAGYLAVALGLGGYTVWLLALGRRLHRREHELGREEAVRGVANHE